MEGLDDLGGGLGALDPNGSDEDVHGGKSPLRYIQDVADDGARGRGDDPDPRGQVGDGFFVNGIEEALGLQLRFQLLEGDLQGTDAPGLGAVQDQLVFAAGPVHVHPRPADDVHPVLEVEFQRPGSGSEEHGPDLAFVVFEGEVEMTRGGPAEVGDLAFDPELIEGGFQDVLDLPREFRDGQNLAGRKQIHEMEVTEGPMPMQGICARAALPITPFAL